MNTDTKRHIDSARQVLVGVVPNPTSQIDQITNALIYKFMDDMDQAAIKQGDEPAFFIGDLEPYAWTRLMDTRMGNQERMNLYSEALMRFSEAKQLPELFRGIFKSAFLPYRSPEILGLFLKEIDFFDYSHPEELGNAYEYLLSIMSSQGDAGQFRTPRHIIDFMVDVVNPTKDDKVLDPACGTGGFLVSSYKHILEQHDGIDDPEKIEKPLTPDERKKLMANFEGYDIDPSMVRIAQVNMYLHQFKNPRIFNFDTLTSEDRWADKFDVILANPPFMSPKGGVSTHKKFSIESNRSEVLFVDYIMNHLRPKGRAGVIVPEGIIFQSGAAHRQLRENLVKDGLYAVVSLPSGVFAPYAGVKTSILLFNNELSKTSSEILFVKIEQDGFDLGATKRPINKNDLPIALDILNEWNTGKKVENKLAVFVEKTMIAESGEYNLSGDRYRVVTDYTNAKWPMVELGEICTLQRGLTYSTDELGETGTGVPFYNLKSIKRESSNKQNDFKYFTGEIKEKHFVSKNDLLIALTDLTPTSELIGSPKLISENEKAAYSADLAKVVFTDNKVSVHYLYHLLRSKNYRDFIVTFSHGANVKHLQSEGFYKYKIPLPPLEIQEQIVAELDGYAGIIVGAKQIVQNWKPKIEIDPEWEKVKLGEVCTMASGGTPSKANHEFWVGKIPWVSSKDMKVDFIEDTEDHISELAVKESATKLVDKDTLLGVVRSGILQHTFPVALTVRSMCHNQDIVSFRANESKLDVRYLFYTFKAENKKILREGIKSGVTVQSFNGGFFKDYVIALPSLVTQRQIVEKIEAERTLVESAKKLIGIYEQKIKEAIAKLWSE